MRKCLFTTLFVLVVATVVFSQSRETGAITGQVIDEQGTALPGVQVTLISPKLMGTRVVTTDAKGEYRFPALPPGEYQIKAELPGFGTVVREKIRVTTTATLAVDITLKPAKISEQVTVVAQSPTVDVKSTETASVTLSSEILRNIPYSQFTADIVHLAPGVSADDVAYGAQSGTGIAYSMDGVNVADPEGGTAWVFLDHNIIEEAKVMGVGLPAEYGNFTGVIFNLITKSGGNAFSGHFEVDFQGTKRPASAGRATWPSWFWGTTNIAPFHEDFPDLTSPSLQFIDASAHLGGPIKKDKIWFYAGLQWKQRWQYETGYPDTLGYKEPHSFFKVTSQLSGKTNMTASVQVDTYLRTNRDGDAEHAAEATVNQTSPEVVGNFTLTHIFSSQTFFDIKAAGFWGYYYLEPRMGRDVSSHFYETDAPGMPGSANKYHDNANYYYLADRARIQANASLTHYAEDFIRGSHDFKFGVEVEHSWNRSRYGYTGVNHSYYYDLWGTGPYGYTYYGNYLRYQYEGYDFNAQYTRAELFAQDSWQVSKRLNIGIGARFSQNWGTVKGVPGVPLKTNRIAPRIGFTFDLLGDKTTVLKAHYGQFTEAMLAAYHMRLSPQWSDYIKYYWDPVGLDWVEFGRIVQNWSLDPNIKHPYMNQFTVSLERELFKDTSISASYIMRDWKNIIGVLDTLATYDPVPYPVDIIDTATGTVVTNDYTVYDLTSGDAHEFLITNVKQGSNPYVLGKPSRRYRGLEVLFNKRFSNKWQLIASYVYSKTTGTIDNDWANDIGWNKRDDLILGDPNFWTDANGNATFDPTHMIKIQGTYVLPWQIYFNVYFRAITGNAWTQRYRSPSTDFDQGRVTFFVEPRGKYHYPMEKTLDLRVEKTFLLAQKYKLGVIFDVFNIFNNHTIQDWGTRIGYDWQYPGDPGDYARYFISTQGHDLYSIPTPRQARIGIRLTF